jgi:GAF domain-containing protein
VPPPSSSYQPGAGAQNATFRHLRRQALQSQTLAYAAAHFTLGGDLSGTLDDVSEQIANASGALAADIIVPLEVDGALVRAWAYGGFGHPPGFMETCERLIREGAVSPLTWAMARQRTSVVPGARKVIESFEEWADLRDVLRLAEWDVMVTVPMIYRGRSIGVIDVYFAPGEDPAEEILAFLRAVADQSAVGIENTRLFEDAQRTAREYATLAGIAADLTLDRPMGDALRSICESVARGTGALASQISLVDEATGALEIFAGSGLPESYMDAASALEASWAEGRRRLIADGKPLVLANLQQVLGGIPAATGLAECLREIDANSGAFIPLFTRGRPVGTLSLFFQPSTGPGSDQLRFFAGVANQVTAAIDNKRLYERMERSARESAALAAIAANITLGQPVRSTLDTVANSVVLATSAITCTVSIADPLTGEMVMSGSAGVPDGFVDVARVVADRPDSRRSRAIATGEPVIQHDVRNALLADTAFESLWNQIRAAPWDTVVSLPVSYGARHVGVLQVGYEAGIEPSPDEWKLLAAIADQLAVAIENARLFMRSESNARQNLALAEIARNVTLDQPMRQTLAEIAANVVAATHGDGSAVFLVDVPSDRIVMTGSHGLPDSLLSQIEANVPASAGFTREAFQDTTQIFVPDARVKMIANPVFASIHDELRAETWDHIQVVPVVFRGAAVGAIYVTYTGGGEPGPDEQQLLDAIANQAAVAIENVRLYQETEARTRELGSLLDLAHTAGSTLEMQPLIEAILARLREVVPCSGVSLATFEEDGYITLIGQDTDPDIRDSLAARVRHGEGTPLGERLHSGRPVIVPDIQADTPAAAALRTKVAIADQDVWSRIRSWMAVPLMSRGRACARVRCPRHGSP